MDEDCDVGTPYILVIGSINMDTFIEIDRLPKRGETITSNKDHSVFQNPGGKGANQAVAARKMKINTKFCGVFGNDSNALMLRNAICEYGVDVSLSHTVDSSSGQAFIFREPDGSNSIILAPGANQRWPHELSESLIKTIQNAYSILLQREIPDYVNIMVAKTAFKVKVPVFLDLGGQDTSLPQELLQYVSTICPNESELERLTGMKCHSIEQAHDAARQLQNRGAKSILVTLGPLGSLYVSEKGIVRQEPFLIDSVIDSTGAGDCFRGVFCASLVMGNDIPTSMSWATAASSLCIQQKAAMSSMPSLEDVQEMLKNCKN